MGCKVEENGNEIIIDPSGLEKPEADHDLARKLGAPIIYWGLLGKKAGPAVVCQVVAI